MKKLLPILLLLLFASCGTTTHVSGVITDTHSWETAYQCGKTVCYQTHEEMVIDGKAYQDDSDSYQKGDSVSFDENSVWGVSNFRDATYHKPDYSWIWILAACVGALVAVFGLYYWSQHDG